MNNKTIVALLGAAIFSSTAYANTDSVHSWGRWEKLFTAAGQPTINLPLNFNFDTDPNPIDSSAFVTNIQQRQPGSSEERFYGVIKNWDSLNLNNHFNGNHSQRIANFEYTADMGSVSYSFISDEGDTMANTIPIYRYRDGKPYYHDDNVIRHAFYTLEDNDGGYQWFSFVERKYSFDNIEARSNKYLIDDQASSYRAYKQAWIITGLRTDLNQLQQLSGISKATYTGQLYHTPYDSVKLDINFKDSSWGGTFKTSTGEYNNAGTLTVINGTIDGANLNATSGNITSTTPLAQATVEASFYGHSANQIKGIIDATTQKQDRYVNLFYAASDNDREL